MYEHLTAALAQCVGFERRLTVKGLIRESSKLQTAVKAIILDYKY